MNRLKIIYLRIYRVSILSGSVCGGYGFTILKALMIYERNSVL